MRNRILVLQNFAGRLGKLRRILIKELKRGTISCEEMLTIAEDLNAGYAQTFILPDGSEIKAGSKGGTYNDRR